MKLMMKAKISRPGLRGGKYWINNKGEVVYGERPHPRAKQASLEEISKHHAKPKSGGDLKPHKFNEVDKHYIKEAFGDDEWEEWVEDFHAKPEN